MPWSRRLFRIVLRAYPKRIRQESGADMWLTFERHLHDARRVGRVAVLDLWRREVIAVWRGGRRARISVRERRREQSRPVGSESTKSFMAFGMSWLDFKLGLRMLVKYPGLTLVGGLGMAVAIAIGAGFFAFFYSHLYPTLPLEEGDRIVALENWDVVVNNEERQSLHDFVTWRGEMETVEDVAAFRTIGRNLIVPGGPAQPVPIARMTASGFRVARVPPLLGRYLVDEDEQAGTPPVIVIGHDVWQTRFAGERDVVGREVRLGSTVHTVVGVMPEGFAFPMNHRFWTPLRANPSDYERGQGPEIFIFGRLAAGVTLDEAQAELTVIGQQSAAAFPETHEQLRPQVLPYTYPLIDIQDVSAWWVARMQLFVSLLLVVVAVNVAVLAYARTATRRGEIAVARLGIGQGAAFAGIGAQIEPGGGAISHVANVF